MSHNHITIMFRFASRSFSSSSLSSSSTILRSHYVSSNRCMIVVASTNNIHQSVAARLLFFNVQQQQLQQQQHLCRHDDESFGLELLTTTTKSNSRNQQTNKKTTKLSSSRISYSTPRSTSCSNRCNIRRGYHTSIKQFKINSGNSYEGVIDKNWTAWKESLRQATVYHLKPAESWLKHDENNPKIQIKRMTAEDLKENDNIPDTDHPYDDMLDVVKLPTAIPEYDNEYAPEFLFIRPDDYDLFYCMHLRQRIILLGNPGISKSWFQWKYLLFCYHPELYNTFQPKHDEQIEDDQKESAALILKEQKLPDWGNIPRQYIFDDIPTIPEVVVRTISGTRSQKFVVNSNEPVKVIKHVADDLQDFTTSNMTILWEPDAEKTPVRYSGIMARMIATLSPDITRYKEFQKNGAKRLYLPCPSEVQLRLMGQIIRDVNVVGNVSDKTIQERIQTYGPFIRLVLTNNDDVLQGYKESRDAELDSLGSNNLGRLLRNITDLSEANINHLSHRLIQYKVKRDEYKGNFYGYGNCFFMSACDSVENSIRTKISSFDMDTLVDHLIAVNRGSKSQTAFVPWFLEEIAVLCSTSGNGLEWDCRSLLDKNSVWSSFPLKFDNMSKDFPTYPRMADNTLYYPSDDQFPLVDMFWKQDDILYAIQATFSDKHPKATSVYENFFKKLEFDKNLKKFHVYYLIMPFKRENFSKEKVYPDSTFYLKVKEVPKNFGVNFSFFALCPPDDFGSGKK